MLCSDMIINPPHEMSCTYENEHLQATLVYTGSYSTYIGIWPHAHYIMHVYCQLYNVPHYALTIASKNIRYCTLAMVYMQ